MRTTITEEDLKLVEEARRLIRARYDEQRHHIGSALISSGGRIYTGVHIEATVGRIAICAEAAAIGSMRTRSRDTVHTIVAVRCPEEGAAMEDIEVASPCGMCRELISDYGRDAMVIIQDQGRLKKVTVKSLLPHRFESAHGL